MDAVTLVIGDGNGATLGVAEVLATWADAGLVEPCLWWAGRVGTGHQVRWVGGDRTEGPMLAVLGSRRFAVIRLVALHLPDDTSSGPQLLEVAEDVEATLTRRLGAGQVVAKLNVVVPASGVAADLPPDLLSTYWDTNLLVVDDDRRGPSQYVGDDVTAERLPAHAALAVATTAGLWPGQAEAPFDGRREGGEQEARLRVVRTFARVIRSHGLSDVVTEQLLGRDQDRPWLADAVGGVAAPEPGRVVARAAADFLAGPGAALCRTPAPGPRTVRLQEVGPWTAVKWMFAFMADLAREAPRAWATAVLDDAQRHVERFVQHHTFGDGPTTVAVRVGSRRAVDPDAAGAGQDVAELLLAWIDDRPAAPALGEVWRSLRALTFGLVDSGPMPAGCPEQVRGQRRLVVTDVGALAPDPGSAPFPPGPGEADASTDTAVEVVGPGEPLRATSLPPARGGDGHVRLSDWLEPHRLTLLGRIGTRLTDDTARAAEALEAAIDTVRAGAGSPDGDPRARRRLNLLWLLIGVLVLTGVGIGVALGVTEVLTPGRATAIVALSILGGAAAAVALFSRYLRRQFQIAHEYAVQLEAYRTALVAAEHEARELLRLEAACAEFDDWATVLATVLHRPGGSVAPPPPDSVTLAALPAPLALGLAEATADTRRAQRLAARVGRDHFRRGWLTALYTGVVADAMRGLKYDDGVDDSEPDPDPDSDARARARLRTGVADGTSAERFGRDIRRVVDDHLETLPPAELFSEVIRTDDTLVDDPGAFLAEICSPPSGPDTESFSQRLWVRRAHRLTVHDEPTVWLSSQLHDSDARPLRPAPGHDRAVLAFRAIRFDATEPAHWADLALFRPPAEEAHPPPVVGDLSHGIG
jgi:hypothetical protein